MWALNKDPADRPNDADEFIAALEQAKAAIVSGGGGQRTASIAALGAAAAGSAAIRATDYLPPRAGPWPVAPVDAGRRRAAGRAAR